MDSDTKIMAQRQVLRDLFEKHMQIKAPTLEKAVRLARHKLPRALRVKAAIWIEAEQMCDHPKLVRRLDRRALDAAYRDIKAHLVTQDPAEQRRTQRLNLLAGLALKMLLLVVGLIILMRWRGLGI
jgi:hypothetical protein